MKINLKFCREGMHVHDIFLQSHDSKVPCQSAAASLVVEFVIQSTLPKKVTFIFLKFHQVSSFVQDGSRFNRVSNGGLSRNEPQANLWSPLIRFQVQRLIAKVSQNRSKRLDGLDNKNFY